MVSFGKINLLPKNDFENTSTGRFIKWAISIGRWIVVFTEFIVICAFLSRFYFDTELANLFDSIRQNKAIVDSAMGFEDNFRQTQEKIKILKNILAEETSPSTTVAEISSLLPLDVSLTDISLNNDKLILSGFSLSEQGINVLIGGMSKNHKFSQINLSNLGQKEGTNEITFNITASLVR